MFIANPSVLCRFLRFLSTEAPSLRRNYPASSVLRASPPSQTARPVSRELPVDPHCDHRWTSRVAYSPLWLHAVANTPAGRMELVRSYDSIRFGLPRNRGGSAPASLFSGPAQRSLKLRPARSPGRLRDPLHQRLQQSRCLHCCSDCCRVERISSRAGIPPLWTIAFSRRTRFPRYQALCPLAGGKACCHQLYGRTDSFQLLVRIAFKMEQFCGWFCCTVSK